MKSDSIIYTERLVLHGYTAQQFRSIFEENDENYIYNFFGFENEDAFNYAKNIFLNGVESHAVTFYFFLLKLKDQEETIGECGFHSWNKRHHKAELYYFMRNENLKNNGYMTEALASIIKYGFNNLHLHRIQALIAAENTASLKLLEKNKFTKEGVLREDYCVDGKQEDSICYSLLKHEWQD